MSTALAKLPYFAEPNNFYLQYVLVELKQSYKNIWQGNRKELFSIGKHNKCLIYKLSTFLTVMKSTWLLCPLHPASCYGTVESRACSQDITSPSCYVTQSLTWSHKSARGGRISVLQNTQICYLMATMIPELHPPPIVFTLVLQLEEFCILLALR